MPWVDTTTLIQGERTALDGQIYNGLDCCITFEVFEELRSIAAGPHNAAENLLYDFERAMQAPALEMMLRGWKIDEIERQEGAKALRSEIAILQEQLNELAMAVWGYGLNARSPKQLHTFFYQKMKLPPVVTYQKGIRKESLNRESLERLADYLHARPIVALILAIRETAKRLEVLETEIDPDGRMRTSYNIAGTETGRWCLDGDTEVLTEFGWLRIADWQHEDIAVWYPDRTICFEHARKVEFENTEALLRVRNTRYDLLATKEHRLPFYSSKGNFGVCTVGERKQLHSAPICGVLTGTFVPVEQTRVCVMTQADGSVIHDRLIRFHFKKERKIKRCQQLLGEANISFKTAIGVDDSTYIYVYDPPVWMRQSKTFDVWCLKHNPVAFISELQHWDGELDRNGHGIVYYTSNLDNAEWAKTMAHLAGHFASLREKRTARERWSPAYRIYIGVDTSTRIQSAHYSQSQESPARVFCAETTSGFFLIRRNGQIAVTGNSSSTNATGTGTNLQNISPPLRRMFIADPGWKLCGIDLEQAESREVGLLLGTLFDDWSYLDACEGGDLHTTVAKLIWPELEWTGEAKADRDIAERVFYRHFSYRDMSKRGGHGTNYMGTDYTMAKHLKVPKQLITTFQERYTEAFPIRRWHRYVAQELETKQYITTPFGNRRFFYGRPNDDTTLREAIAYGPQSATAIRNNLALWRIWHYMGDRVQVLGQVHDFNCFQFRETEDEREIVAEALRLTSTKMHLPNGRVFDVPGEAKTGWNWGYYQDDTTRGRLNLEGMKKFNSAKGDPRVRQNGKERLL